MDNLKIYHGSNKIIKEPIFGVGKKYNDYGIGFYSTEDMELAKEWSCTSEEDGFVNCYELKIDNLRILNLSNKNYNILNWITLLVENRILKINTPVMKSSYDWLVKNYKIHIEDYDIIIGYRADDSYFSFARAFLNNEITLEQLELTLKLGDLGEQVVLKSEKAFKSLKYIGFERTNGKKYFNRRCERDSLARKKYFELLEQNSNGRYIVDLIRGDLSGSI